MITLAVLDILRTQFNQEPARVQSAISLIALAFTPQILYGLIIDTFPIFGSRKKNYLVLCGMLQAAAGMLASDEATCATSQHLVIYCFVFSVCMAINDVVIDGVMVIMAKRDPEGGSEDLQSYSLIMMGIGGISGALMGGMITNKLDPHYVFYIVALFGCLISCFGMTMDDAIEGESSQIISMGFKQRFRTVLRKVWKGMQIHELNQSMLFFVLRCFVPSFGNYLYFFNMSVVGFSQMKYALVMMVGFLMLIIGSLIYTTAFKQSSFRKLMIAGIVINFIGSCFTLLYVNQIYFGLNPLVFCLLTSTVTDSLSQALMNLPMQVLFAKLIPEDIESSMFALLTGLMDFSQSYLSPQLGNMVNKLIGVSQDNMEDLWKLCLIEVCFELIPLAFIKLIPTRAEVASLQQVLEYERLRAEKKTLMLTESDLTETIAKKNKQGEIEKIARKERIEEAVDEALVEEWEKLDPNIALRMGVINVQAKFSFPLYNEIIV